MFNGCDLCSGSDQLFGIMPYGKIDTAYYLDFKNDSNKCFSLSSSFGRTDLILEDSVINELKKYMFISLRERTACDLLKTYNINSHNFLYPTLIVNN